MIGIIAPLLREGVRQAGRYVVRAVNLQDDALNTILRTAPTRNMLGRGGIRGVRHGLAGGALASPLIEEMKTSNSGFQKAKRPSSNKQRKKYQTNRSDYRRRSAKYNKSCNCNRYSRSRF